MFLQLMVNGIVLGSVYTLIALGFAITFSIMRLLNFAHGELYMVGTFMCWMFINRILNNWGLAIIIAIIVGAGLGFIVERVFRPTYGKGLLPQILIALGLMIVLQEGIQITFGATPHTVKSVYTTTRHIGPVQITDERILILCTATVLVVAVLLFFQRTRIGKAMRAVAGNKLLARLSGINANQMSTIALMGGAALAGAAGALLAPIYIVHPFIGSPFLARAFVICVLGGLGSIGGTAIAGFSLGILESLFVSYVSLTWYNEALFGIFVLILLFRPTGLFGKGAAFER